MHTDNYLITPLLRRIAKANVIALAAAIFLALAFSVPAHAANLVMNGGFETTIPAGSTNFFIGYSGYPQLASWSYGAAPYPNAAVYTYAGANGPGACRPGGCFPLYGPGNGFNNGFVASPDGGNFLASDGEAQYPGAITQTISGLNPGHQYALSFVWAGNQYLDSSSIGYTGPLTADWQVSLGAQTFTTPVANYAGHGFTGWMTQTFTYTATSSSEVLTFLAQGTPNGLPPVALLDGVTLTAATPEPGTITLMATGLIGGVGALRRYRLKKRG